MMVFVATRSYEQRLRAKTAQETRRRVLDALYERLREAPAEPVSVDRIARMAGVARSTVYLIFGSRAGLFDALGTDLIERSGYARLVEAAGQPDARERLRSGFRAASEMFAANRDVTRALFSMAALNEEDAGQEIRRWEKERADGMARLARHLAEQAVLRLDVSVQQATDLLWLLASFDSFDMLYTGRGMSLDEAVRLLIDTAERSLYR